MATAGLRKQWKEYAFNLTHRTAIAEHVDPVGQLPDFALPLLEPRRYKCLWGGRGCIDEDTLLDTPGGYVKVKDFMGGPIFCFDGKDRAIAFAEKPVKYAPEELFKITLKSGATITVTARHKFLSSLGWTEASQLYSEPTLRLLCPLALADQPQTSYVFCQSMLLEDARRYLGKLLNFLYGYFEGSRQCDEPPLPASSTYLGLLRRLTDEPQHSSRTCFHKDGQAIACEDSHLHSLRRLSTEGAQLAEELKNSEDWGSYSGDRSSVLLSAIALISQLSHESNNLPWLVQELSQLFLSADSEGQTLNENSQIISDSLQRDVSDDSYLDRPYNFSCNHDPHYTTTTVQSIEPVGQKAFYDLFVPFFNNYITKGGIVNHNSSKSYCAADALLILAKRSRCRILCVREFQNSIKDSAHYLLSERIEALGFGGFFQVQETTIRGENGSEFIFKGIQRNVQSIKSMAGVTHCWVEEAQAISANSWRILVPTIREPKSEIWVTFNPENEGDPVYQEFVLNTPDSAIAYVERVNWNRNPYFPEVLEAERLKMLAQDPDAYDHIWEGGLWAKSDAQIFNGKWIVDDFEPGPDWDGPYFGADFGFAADPTALVKSWIYDGDLWIEQESYEYKLETDKMGEQWMRDIPGCDRYEIRADSARPDTISYLRRHGFPGIVGAKKGAGSIEDGIEFMKSFDKIHIHSRCKNVQQEFRLYSYKVDPQTDKVLRVIVDANQHAIDSARYSLEPQMKAWKDLKLPKNRSRWNIL